MKKPEVTWWDQLWFILLFVSSNSILIILIHCIFLNIDRLKKKITIHIKHVRISKQPSQKKYYSITKQNIFNLSISISEELTCFILI